MKQPKDNWMSSEAKFQMTWLKQ